MFRVLVLGAGWTPKEYPEFLAFEVDNDIWCVNGDDYYVQVGSGNKHACALTRGYRVHCWGRNDYGESSPPSDKFVQVSIKVVYFFSFCLAILASYIYLTLDFTCEYT